MGAGYDELTCRKNETGIERFEDGSVEVTVVQRYTCRDSANGFDLKHIYTILPAGHLLVGHEFKLDDEVEDVQRLGVRLSVAPGFEQLAWFGRGPHENYVDRKAGTPVGLYESTVTEQYVPYIVPQENGNKEDTRWLCLTDSGNTTLQVQAEGTLGFSVLHFTPEDFTQAYHTHELTPRDGATLLLDCRQRGLGGASCGPDTLDEYRIQPGVYRLAYSLRFGAAEELGQRQMTLV
jgi:beta-galactosidase